MHDMDDVDCHIQTLEEFLTDTADSQTAYDALCFYNFHNTVPDGSGEWWQGDMLKAVEKVRFSDRGIVVVHHALGAFREWSVWSDLVGIGDRSFGWFTDQTLKAEVVDTSHPITQGLKSWELTDETYTMAEPGAGTRVLVKTDHPNSMKTLAWTRSYEGLRVACCVLGHDAKAYTNPGFRTLLNRSLLWTAGRI
jgi:type 1 glutamine amidotransferase